jgi:hypothetical protein
MAWKQAEFALASPKNLQEHVSASGKDDGFEPQKCCSPTRHAPGTWEKVEVLAQRLRDCQPLWHDSDAKLERPLTEYDILTGMIGRRYGN